MKSLNTKDSWLAFAGGSVIVFVLSFFVVSAGSVANNTSYATVTLSNKLDFSYARLVGPFPSPILEIPRNSALAADKLNTITYNPNPFGFKPEVTVRCNQFVPGQAKAVGYRNVTFTSVNLGQTIKQLCESAK